MALSKWKWGLGLYNKLFLEDIPLILLLARVWTVSGLGRGTIYYLPLKPKTIKGCAVSVRSYSRSYSSHPWWRGAWRWPGARCPVCTRTLPRPRAAPSAAAGTPWSPRTCPPPGSPRSGRRTPGQREICNQHKVNEPLSQLTRISQCRFKA